MHFKCVARFTPDAEAPQNGGRFLSTTWLTSGVVKTRREAAHAAAVFHPDHFGAWSVFVHQPQAISVKQHRK